MNYLFFDVECAKCEKNGVGFICELSYIICDKNFNILEKTHFLINPDHSFDEYALAKILRHTKREYELQPLFPTFYQHVKEVFESPTNTVIGHTTKGDIGYILSECARYGLPKIECEYFDIREPFQALEKEKYFSGLNKMIEKLGVDLSGNYHDASVDTFATMCVARGLCEKYGLSIEQLLPIKPPSKKNNNKK